MVNHSEGAIGNYSDNGPQTQTKKKETWQRPSKIDQLISENAPLAIYNGRSIGIDRYWSSTTTKRERAHSIITKNGKKAHHRWSDTTKHSKWWLPQNGHSRELDWKRWTTPTEDL